MGDVHDFQTGNLMKRCYQCCNWKDIAAFNFSAFGKYQRAAKCRSCSPRQLLAAPASTIPDETA